MTNLTFTCEKCGEPNRYYDGGLGFEGAYCEVCGWLQDLNDPTNGSYWHPVPKNSSRGTRHSAERLKATAFPPIT
jgi:hypothetical protein